MKFTKMHENHLREYIAKMDGNGCLPVTIKSAIVKASAIATPPLFVWACIEAYAERGYFAIGGEIGVLFLPLIAAGFASLLEEEQT